jgi:hypothetical protein
MSRKVSETSLQAALGTMKPAALADEEALLAHVRTEEAATEALVARQAGVRDDLSPEARAAVHAFMQQVDARRLADGRAVIVNGRLTSRPVTDEEATTGTFPVAWVTRELARPKQHGARAVTPNAVKGAVQ